ncbi:MAG TPA: hypothetical protein VGC99_27625 [Candidatus Tectomicrobia bacterium]
MIVRHYIVFLTTADRLCISEAAVPHHLTSIYGKLAVGDGLELMIYAYRHGIVNFPAMKCDDSLMVVAPIGL